MEDWKKFALLKTILSVGKRWQLMQLRKNSIWQGGNCLKLSHANIGGVNFCEATVKLE